MVAERPATPAPRLRPVDLKTIEAIYTGLLVLAAGGAGVFSAYVVYKLFKGQG